MTALLTNDDSQVVVDDIRLMIESQNGALVQQAPGVLLAQLPDSGVTFLTGHPNIRKISKTALNATTEGITDANAKRAIDYFNWVVTGGAGTAINPTQDPFGPVTSEMPAHFGPISDIAANAAPQLSGDHLKLGVPTLVNLVFVNAATIPAFTDAQKAETSRQLALAMSWWNSRIQMHYGVSRPVNPSFYQIREYTVTTDAGDPSELSDINLWVNSAMSKTCALIGDCTWFDATAQNNGDDWVRYQKNVQQFNIKTRQQRNVQDAFTVFVANKNIDEFPGRAAGAYAISLGGAWWSIGPDGSVLSRVATMAHETGHLYWACDEYAESPHAMTTGCDRCDASRLAMNGNADAAPGTNTIACVLEARKHNDCMMKSLSAINLTDGDFDSEIDKLCWFSREQIGWVSVTPKCWNEVNWNITGAPGGTQWEGNYFVDSRAPRMPLKHWITAPEMVRADSGTTNGFSMNFSTNPLISACMNASSASPRTTSFSVRWRRVVTLNAGDYVFTSSTGSVDDEVKVYVDKQELKMSATAGTYERIKLDSSGDHEIQIDYYQISGANPSVSVNWSQVTTQACTTGAYNAKLTAAATDLCSGPTVLEITADGGTPPYRVTVQRNNDTPITYDMTDLARTLTITPDSVGGTSRFNLISVFDKNNCKATITSNEVRVNIDTNLPRITPKINVDATGCSYRVYWPAASVCPLAGGSIVYQLDRVVQPTGSNPVRTTVLSCSTATEYVDNNIQSNTVYIYVLKIFRIPPGKTCTAADMIEAHTSPLAAVGATSSCPGSTTALTANAVTSAYGSLATLTARLTGGGVGLSGRSVTFELGGKLAGTATTNSNGDASLVTTMTLPVGTHAGGVIARFSGDATWKTVKGTNTVTVSTTCTPADITVQPVDKNIAGGASTTLSLTTSGTAPVTVKWYKANGVYAGTGTAISVAPADTTQYYAMVSNACRIVQSKTITVTVCNAPSITVQPAGGGTFTSGTARTLSVTAGGTATLFYRWYKNGVAITGATAASYSFTATESANYHVVITNGCGTATSNTVAVNVCTAAPVITAQPQNVGITYGASTNLTVTASGVTPAYQWYYGNGTIISGANSATLNVAPTTNTTYKVVVSNTCGSVTSNTVTVSVCKPPAITANPTNQETNSGQPVSLYASASGTSLTYQWYYSNNTAVPGATSNQLTVSPTVTTSYYMKATNTCGTAQTATRTVTVCTPPNITTEPTGKMINAGQSATLTCYASSNVNETYQWYTSNGSAISGANDNSLTVSPTATTSYYCVVTNSCGTDTSRTVTVSICEPMQILQEPSDKTISAGQSATMTAHLYGSSSWSLQWYENGVAMPGRTAAGTTVSPTVTTTYYLRATNPCSSIQTRTVTITVN